METVRNNIKLDYWFTKDFWELEGSSFKKIHNVPSPKTWMECRCLTTRSPSLTSWKWIILIKNAWQGLFALLSSFVVWCLFFIERSWCGFFKWSMGLESYVIWVLLWSRILEKALRISMILFVIWSFGTFLAEVTCSCYRNFFSFHKS